MPEGTAASVPPGTRVYAVGDVHGRFEPLARLVAMVRRDALGADSLRCVLIFLGDYVDRGLESRDVIDFLLADPAPGFETVFLKGNHEAWALAFLQDAAVGGSWLAAGGQETLFSYGVSQRLGLLDADGLESLREAFAGAIPGTHRRFLEGLASQHIEGDYMFAHAGVRPGTPIEEQRDENLLWIRDEFIGDGRDHGKVVVHGHSFAREPDVRSNRIGIDTGAYATGCLTCLVLEGKSRRFLST